MQTKHELQNGHVFRGYRFPPALDPGHFPIDGRNTTERLSSALRFSRLLTYFDSDGKRHAPAAAGDMAPWEAFLRTDPSFLLAEIACFRPMTPKPEDAKHHGGQTLRRLMAWSDAALAQERTALEPGRRGILATALADAIRRVLTQDVQGELFNAFGLRSVEMSEATNALLLKGETDTQATDSGIGAALLGDTSDPLRALTLLNRIMGELANTAQSLLTSSLGKPRDSPPQTALYLAFDTLSETATARLNGVTGRHLDFYYRTVLRLAPRAAVPDVATVWIEPKPDAPAFRIPAGTLLRAGLRASGSPVLFATDRALAVEPAQLAALRTLRLSRTEDGTRQVREIRAQTLVGSPGPTGKPPLIPEAGWPLFGDPAEPADDSIATQIGIAIAAPILGMAGGHRRLDLSLTLAPGPGQRVADLVQSLQARAAELWPEAPPRLDELLSRGLRIAFSTVKQGPLPVAADISYAADPGQRGTGILTLSCVLDDTAPPIGTGPGATLPWISLALAPKAPICLYSFLCGLHIQAITIKTAVTGLGAGGDLALAASGAPVDPTKPFAPFGVNPMPGDSFAFAAPELTGRRLTSLALRLGWRGLPAPPQDFTRHYSDYALGITNDSFKVALATNRAGQWVPVPGARSAQSEGLLLFRSLPDGKGIAPETVLSFDTAQLAPTRSTPPRAGPYRIDPGQPDGVFRLTLVAPPQGFATRAYTAIVAERALATARRIGRGRKPAPLPPPPPPLAPKVTRVSIDYEAAAQAEAPFATGDAIELYRLQDIGPMTPEATNRLIAPELDADGYAYFGFRGARPGASLSLLLRIEDSALAALMPASIASGHRIAWHYRAGHRWRPLPPSAILRDGTSGLVQTGVLVFELPQDAATPSGTPAASDGVLWLAASTRARAGTFGRLVGIGTNAVTATRQMPVTEIDSQNENVLPSDAITRTETDIPGLAAVHQPDPSRGGRPAEDSMGFRTRVAQRLGQKNRAIAPNDYASLALEMFPELSDAAVVPAPPDTVLLVVVPAKPRGQRIDRPILPLAKRQEMARRLQALAPLGAARLAVVNARFEPVQMRASLALGPGTLPSIAETLSATIDRLIAPWLFDPNLPVPIGVGSLSPASLVSGLSPYSDRVALKGVSLVQLQRDLVAQFDGGDARIHDGMKDTARRPRRSDAGQPVLMPSSPASVLVPARAHSLEILRAQTGVGDMVIGSDFAIVAPALRAGYRDDPRNRSVTPTRAGLGNLRLGETMVVASKAAVQAPDAAAPALELPPDDNDMAQYQFASPGMGREP